MPPKPTLRPTLRWERRILTILAVVVASLVVGVVWGPQARDAWHLWRLGSPDPDTWQHARKVLVGRGDSEGTIARLNLALDTDDDRKFLRIAGILGRVGQWETPTRSQETLDRFWAVQIALSDQPVLRLNLLESFLLTGRDNRYIRDALAAAVRDPQRLIRARAALLAARFKDDASLRTLLSDTDPLVRSAAVIDAGLAGRTTLTADVAAALNDADGTVSGSAAYALALLDPQAAGEAVVKLLAAGDAGPQRDRLLCALRLLDARAAGEGLEIVLERCRRERSHPSAMAMLLAAHLKYPAAGVQARSMLAEATQADTTLTEAQVLAAMKVADALKLPVRGEVDAICRKLWSPEFELTLTRAAGLLGRQIAMDQPGPAPADCIRTLQMGAVYAANPTATQPSAAVQTTPVASAAAAAALWMLSPRATYIQPPPEGAGGLADVVQLKYDRDSSAFYVHSAAGSAVSLAGDYLAWHLGRSGRDEAMDTALAMLPGSDGPQWARVYDNDVRSAGAMLLALAARTPQQRTIAVARIEQHLRNETDFFVIGSYRCALLILGQDRLEQIRKLYSGEVFPQRRSITALLVSGDRAVLDDMLWGPGVTEQDVINLLVYRRVDEVLAATAADLPVPDIESDGELQLWQVQILRDAYVLRGANAEGR